MATISITVPDAVVPRVLDAMADTYTYDPATDGTKAQFAKKQIAAHVKSIVVAYETRIASEEAAATAQAAVIAEMGGIS